MNIIYPDLHQIFRDIVSWKAPSYPVGENEHFIAILDTSPMAKGHTLVLPKRPLLELDELSEAECLSLHRMIRYVSDKLNSKFEPLGITVMQNGGACNSVSYLHVHVIPRYDTVSIWKDELRDETPLSDVAELLR